MKLSFADWFLFASTFLIGLIVGVWLYQNAYVPAYVENTDLTTMIETAEERFRLAGATYGGCTMTGQCDSFVINHDRSYTYAPGGTTAVESGKIPRLLFAQLQSTLTLQALAPLSVPVDQSCASFVDGIDVEYTVTLEGNTIALDSCYTALAEGSAVAELLNDTFQYVREPERYEEQYQVNNSISGRLEATLREQFQ